MEYRSFNKSYTLMYHEVDKYKKATVPALFNYLQETAISHSESVGYGIDALKTKGVAWVLNKWAIEIKKYPEWNESITVQTWPSSFERFYATREFYIMNSQSQIIAKATSLWIFLNLNNKRPTRIPSEIGESYGVSPLKALDNAFNEIVPSGAPVTELEIPIKRCDIDTNEHVNNIKYIEWLLETVPEETYNHYNLHSLEILYKKEISSGSVLSSSFEIPNAPSQFLHSIIDKNTDNELAVAKTKWI